MTAPLGGWLNAGLMVYDDLQRADTDPGDLGNAPSGGAWDLRGKYVSGYPLPAAETGQITDGVFITSDGVTVYAVRVLRTTPNRMGATMRWGAGNSGVQHGTIAMVVSSDENLTNDMLHFRADPFNWNLQIRIAGGAFIDLAAGAFSPTLVVDESESYSMEIGIAGNTVILCLAGEIFRVTDPRISARLGKWVFWEHSYNNADTYQDFLKIESMWAGTCLLTDGFPNPVNDYDDNADAIEAGQPVGAVYQSCGKLKIVREP